MSVVSVALVRLPNTNYFLGTFDTINFSTWWKSNPIPGNISEILQSYWVYAQYHICIARMSNGTYSVYQSRNYGIDWVSVLNTAETIHTALLIEFGWIIIATSGGWYESRNSGRTWEKLSSMAPGCKAVARISATTLAAHDGFNIWRSTDFGHTWSRVQSFSYYCPPCISGGHEVAYAGFGADILRSVDDGKSYGYMMTWTTRNTTVQGIFTMGVSQGPDDMVTVVQGYNTDRSTLVHYYFKGTSAYAAIGIGFETAYSPIAVLSGYEILPVGTGLLSMVCVYSGTKYDATRGKYVPHIVTTTNGMNWTATPSLTGAAIYSGPDLTQQLSTGGPFIVEDYVKWSWHGPVCHNSGFYVNSVGVSRRGLSYSMDLLLNIAQTHTKYHVASIAIKKRRLNVINLDICNKKGVDRRYVLDMLTKKAHFDSVLMDMAVKTEFVCGYELGHALQKTCISQWEDDILIQRGINKTLPVGGYVQRQFEVTCDLDIATALRLTTTYDMDALFKKRIEVPQRNYMYLARYRDHTINFRIKLIGSHLLDIMIGAEKNIIQAVNIIVPDIGYMPLDSRDPDQQVV